MLPTGTCCPGRGSALVGDRGVILERGFAHGEAGDERFGPVRADRQRESVALALGPVVAAGPQPRAGGGVVADRGVIRERGAPRGAGEAGPGDKDRAAARVDRQRAGDVSAAGWPVVPAGPARGAG